MQTKTLLVTPTMARDMLTKNPRNRSLRRSNVRYLAEELKSGRWKLTHQGVAVATDGTLLDGQHRLSAIVEANVSALLNVSFECDPDMFSVIDTGSARTHADVLRISGGISSQETTTGAAVKLVYLYREQPHLTWTGEVSRISSTVVLEEFQKAPELYNWAIRLANRARGEFNALSLKSATAAFAIIALHHGEEHGIDADGIEAFVMSVATGANMVKGDPRHTFRQQLINGWNPGSLKGARASQVWLACWIRIFNLYVAGIPLKLFKTPNVTPMPKILG